MSVKGYVEELLYGCWLAKGLAEHIVPSNCLSHILQLSVRTQVWSQHIGFMGEDLTDCGWTMLAGGLQKQSQAS